MQAARTFEPNDAVNFAWRWVKEDPWTLVGSCVFATLANLAVSGALKGLDTSGASLFDPTRPLQLPTLGTVGWVLATSLVSLAFSTYMLAGVTRLALRVASGQRYQFSDIFSGGARSLSIFTAGVLFGIAIILGLLLLVIPGLLVLTVGSLLWPIVVCRIVETGEGPIEAWRSAWALSAGSKSKMGTLLLFLFGLSMVGFAACCVGLFVVVPLGHLAEAYAYLRLTGQKTVAAGQAA